MVLVRFINMRFQEYIIHLFHYETLLDFDAFIGLYHITRFFFLYCICDGKYLVMSFIFDICFISYEMKNEMKHISKLKLMTKIYITFHILSKRYMFHFISNAF